MERKEIQENKNNVLTDSVILKLTITHIVRTYI